MDITGPGVAAGIAVAVPVVAAIGAAIIARRSADRATAAQVDVAHMQRLEQRLATRKLHVYEPILDYLRKSLDDADNIDHKEMADKLSAFGGWVSIVGSDDAVRAFGHHMQGAYNDAPPFIAMRLYAEFLLAARRDLGDPSTDLTPLDVWTAKINDLYSSEGRALRRALTLPLEDAFSEQTWDCPWLRTETKGPEEGVSG